MWFTNLCGRKDSFLKFFFAIFYYNISELRLNMDI